MMIETIFAIAVFWLIAAVTPGPNFLICVQAAFLGHRRGALLLVAGIACGTVLWGLAGFVGVQALFTAAPQLYFALKLLGAVYLIYLGLRAIVGSFRLPATMTRTSPAMVSLSRSWRLGLLTNMTNPKTAAFTASLFAATLPPEPPVWLGVLAVAVMGFVSLCWYSIVVVVFGMERPRRMYNRARAWFERLAGALFVGLGVRLATQP